jgi:hypothetical protein
MNAHSKLVVATLVLIGLAMLTPKAEAQLLDESMTVTFSAPVEVPGRVLPAGTYVFAAVEPHVTRVLSADGKVSYGIFLMAPEERQEPVEKGTIILGENTTDSPERVKALFYPGDSVGNEFIYPAPSSHHHKLTSVMEKAPKGFDIAVTDTAQGGLASAEFIGRHAERVIVNSGAAIGHAAKYLVL